jgi:hypothetical protein
MILPVFLDPTRHKNAFGEYQTVDVPDSWPAPHHRPRERDTLGEKIVAYAAQHRNHPNFPSSPWSTRHGEIFLPDLDEPEELHDEMPKYRVKDAAAFIGCVMYTEGQIVPFAGWPANMSALEPANQSAERVVRYAIKYGAGRNLVGQPWSAGRLHFENPALAGKPEPARHRGSISGPQVVSALSHG